MLSIKKCPVPVDTLLHKYTRNGSYADCYLTEVPDQISFPEYLFAFYTTPLFKLERLILKLTVSKPSTDMQVQQLADGISDRFAAWNVEGRGENEILMCDFKGLTRSWLMAVPADSSNRTRTYFGSAVVPTQNPKTGNSSLGLGFQALLGFHKIYSVLLLYSAKSRIVSQQRRTHERQKGEF